MTITPNLCGMAGSLHKKFQYCCFSQHSIYKAKAVLDFGVSWCGNLQLKNRFELKPCFLKRFWCAEWNQKYLESNFSKHCQELCVPLGRGEAGILQGKRDLNLKNLYLQSHNVVWLWDPAKLGLFPPIFHVCHMRAVMLIIPEEQWTIPPPGQFHLIPPSPKPPHITILPCCSEFLAWTVGDRRLLPSWQLQRGHLLSIRVSLGKKKLKTKEVNIHEQWKDLVFRSLGELQAWEFLQCTSDLSPGGEANINPNECGGETWLREKQSR